MKRIYDTIRLTQRRTGQGLCILPHPDLDPATPIGELFVQGPVQLVVGYAEEGTAQMALYADPRFQIIEDDWG